VETDKNNGERVRINGGLILSAAAFVYIVWRILAAGDYDTNTALGIIQTGGAANVALGIALSSAALVVLALNILWLLAVYFEWPGISDLPNDLKISLSLPLLAPTLFLLPAFVSALNVLFLAFMSYRWRREADGNVRDLTGTGWALVLFVAWIAGPMWMLISTPWLPTERFDVYGRGPFTGYAVGRDGDELVVLVRRSEPRLQRVPSDGLERSLCSDPKPWFLKTLPQLVDKSYPYPTCPRTR
jgi:hypothetical protein